MIAQNFIQKELRLINEMYFSTYNSEIGRWQVRKWKGIFPKKLYLWREFSENIFTICKEEYTQDMGLQDVGYMSIDMRAVDAIRESNYWKADSKRKLSEMDWRNERKRRQNDEQLEYESKAAAKNIWRKLHEPRVIQGGKWDYYKGD